MAVERRELSAAEPDVGELAGEVHRVVDAAVHAHAPIGLLT
jgi:hypothetical protein